MYRQVKLAFCVSAILAIILFPASGSPAAEKRGTLCTTEGGSIYDYQLDQWIDSVVPPTAKRLLVFTQCFGGDCVDNFTGANTTVLSATSPGQTAAYGGYDDDASKALKPGAGTTAQNVHNAGVSGKASGETPSTGGGLSPSGFNLAPVSAGGDVQSRHVVVYAGIPDSSPGRDNTQRDTIKSNFAGQTNTTVTTVGGSGASQGWDKPGSAAGLKAAINEAAQAIQNSPDPSKEQFILFVTDHGDLHNVGPVITPVPPATVQQVNHVQSFVTGDIEPADVVRPGFSVEIELTSGMPWFVPPTGYIPYFAPDAFRLMLDPEGAEPPVELLDFEETYIEFGDGIIGNEPGEGFRIEFDCDPDWWVESFFDVFYDVEFFNNSPEEVLFREFSQDSGPVAKGVSLLPGDANLDGVVDGQDFTILKANYGLSGGWGDGDFNGDELIDGQDFTLLKANFGASTTVPEPTMLLVVAAGLPLLLRRKR